MREWSGLVLWLALSLFAGAVGALFAPDGEWYARLRKPRYTPSPRVFTPVWTVLYLMMGVAAWRVWRETGFRGHAAPLWWFLAQLAANALWAWLFFGLRRAGWALADIGLLLLLLAPTLVLFFRQDRLAGWLLVPYLAWTAFAFYLNYCIVRLNTDR